MPHKFNANRRDKIPKQKHRVTNWAAYNESLRRRGDLTVWISDDALGLWSAPPRTTPGGQPHYSDLAIELCLTLGVVFKEVFPIVRSAVQNLRNTDTPNDGLMNHFVKGDFITSNDDEMLSILVGLLMGAQDNIAAATAWILAYLAHFPDLQDQVRAEIKQIGPDGVECV